MKNKRIYKALLGGILFLAGVAVGLTVCRLHGGLHPAKGAVGEGYGADGPQQQTQLDQSGQDELLQADQTDQAPVLRIRGDKLEAFDGRRWSEVASVTELAAEDPLVNPPQAWHTFAGQLAQDYAAEGQTALDALRRENNTLAADVDRTPIARPAQSAVPETPSAPAGDTPSTPTPTPTPTPDPTPEPPADPAPDDGEDMGWSEDYL